MPHLTLFQPNQCFIDSCPLMLLMRKVIHKYIDIDSVQLLGEEISLMKLEEYAPIYNDYELKSLNSNSRCVLISHVLALNCVLYFKPASMHYNTKHNAKVLGFDLLNRLIQMNKLRPRANK